MIWNKNQVKSADIALNDMGNGLDVIRTGTCNAGDLIPIEYLPTLPGDVLRPVSEVFMRLQPLVAPVMHEVFVKVWYFHVPNRLIWTNWENFITGGELGNDSTVHPYIITTANDYADNTLGDYLSFPKATSEYQHSALKFRAYQLIYKWHFRNHDIQTAPTISLGDGQDTTTVKTIQKVNWLSDYFTGYPWTQRGTEQTLSFGTTAPIQGGVTTSFNDDTTSINNVENTLRVFRKKNSSDVVLGKQVGTTSNVNNGNISTLSGGTQQSNGSQNMNFDPNDTLYVSLSYPNTGTTEPISVDLTGASTVTISQLRETFAKQTVFEILAKVGGFFTQYIRGIFGVETEDFRMQIPEFLGVSTTKIMFSEVLQTSEDGTTPLGTMGGHGMTGSNVTTISQLNVKEHGLLMGIMAIIPTTMYFQGLEKQDTYSTRWDYFHPQLQGLSMQPILNKELYINHTDRNGAFCYQPIYWEYRRRRNTIHGEFKDSLDYWTMRREFSSDPSFNSEFITCNPVTDIFQTPSEPAYYYQVKTSYPTALRKVQLDPPPVGLK